MIKDLNRKKVTMRLPYLQSIREERGGVWNFTFNGGQETAKLAEISSIMIYGDCDASFQIGQLEKIARAGVPIIIHRRNIAQPIYIVSGERPDPEDTISRQLAKREKSRYSSHISRQLLLTKMKSMSYLVEPIFIPKLANVKQLRSIEAKHAKSYWKNFFIELGHDEWARRGDNPARSALDAASRFLSGIILRWITYHKLSAFHGFLHETSDYPGLVYDLMEPYRGLFELELLKLFKNSPEKNWTALAIKRLKEKLDEKTYVPLTNLYLSNLVDYP